MNILIICSYYPPDSAISAVRPYMFAKYLSKLGNNVTVLRSGAFNSTPDQAYIKLEGVKVISFLGESSEAELFERNQTVSLVKSSNVSHPKLRKNDFIKKIYHYINEPNNTRKRINSSKYNYSLQKKAIDSINESFDIVISTYSELENVFAGAYAAEHFNAKWIMDFRDSIVDHINHERYMWNLHAKKYQLFALKNADLCTTVSNGLSQELARLNKHASIETLYNGYDDDNEVITQEYNQASTKKALTICYTGQIYDLRLDGLKRFVAAIKHLIDNDSISKDQISFVYAGKNSDAVSKLFDEFSISDILDNHGQLSRTEAIELQNNSDVFLVLSWNTKKAKGILTGKFYEGVRAKKPIISIVEGDVPESELLELNNKYNYGFCYESCNRNMSSSYIEQYVCNLCLEKNTKGHIDYVPSNDLTDDFCYEGIVNKLNNLAIKLCEVEK